jgi:hypothetical protein
MIETIQKLEKVASKESQAKRLNLEASIRTGNNITNIYTEK